VHFDIRKANIPGLVQAVTLAHYSSQVATCLMSIHVIDPFNVYDTFLADTRSGLNRFSVANIGAIIASIGMDWLEYCFALLVGFMEVCVWVCNYNGTHRETPCTNQTCNA
jgi:hypothetical protein